MSEQRESFQDDLVLPTEGEIAHRPHRAYDVEVDKATSRWLEQTPTTANVPFVPIGNIPEKAVGYLTRGDGPKAVLNIQDDIHEKLPRVVGITKGQRLKSFSKETIDRREAIAKKIGDVVCARLLEFQGNALNNLLKNGTSIGLSPELGLVGDVGFGLTSAPLIARGMYESGWVEDEQEVYEQRRADWLESLYKSIREQVEQFISEHLQVQGGKLLTAYPSDCRPYSARSDLTKATLERICSVECRFNKKTLDVAVTFDLGNLDHSVGGSLMEPLWEQERRIPQRTHTSWEKLPEVAWEDAQV